MMGIYQITCTATGMCYIGSSTNFSARVRSHRSDLCLNRHPNSHLQNAWNKYGDSNFTFEIIQPVMNVSNIAKIEESWIRIKDSCNPNKGFNKQDKPTLPNFYGKSHSEESRLKMSLSRKGVKFTESRKASHRKGMSKLKNLPRDPEIIKDCAFRNKIKRGLLGAWQGEKLMLLFLSISDAKKAGYSNIQKALRGEIKVGGYTWKYINDI